MDEENMNNVGCVVAIVGGILGWVFFLHKLPVGPRLFGSLVSAIVSVIVFMGIIGVVGVIKAFGVNSASSKTRFRRGRGLSSQKQEPLQSKNRFIGNVEEKFLRYLFSMLAKLAKADGRIDAEEVRTMEIVFDHFGFALQRREYCSKVFNEAKNYTKDIYWFAEQFSKVANDEVCIFVYELLWDVACADGWLHPLEKNILCMICPFLRVPSQCFDDNFRRRRSAFIEGDKWNAYQGTRQNKDKARNWRRAYVSGKSTLAEAYELLECEQSAIMEELSTAYHRIAKRYHPDLLRANGVPEEMIKEATERMAQVNAAWEDIRRARSV